MRCGETESKTEAHRDRLNERSRKGSRGRDTGRHARVSEREAATGSEGERHRTKGTHTHTTERDRELMK